MKNKAFIILFVVNILLYIADTVTTQINPNKHLLETNALFTSFNYWWLIDIANILFFVLFYIWYKKSTLQWFKYLVINQLVLIIIFRIMAIRTAIFNLQQHMTAEQVTTFLVQNPGIVLQTQQQNFTISILCLK